MTRTIYASVLVSAVIVLGSIAPAQQTLQFSLVDLGLMGGVQTAANAINNSGQVVGNVTYSDGSQACFLWTRRGTVIWGNVWAGPKGLNTCDARAIDQNGSVAGSIRKYLPSLGYPIHAFRRTPSGAMVDIRPPNGNPTVETYGYGIDPSGSGTVVGTGQYPWFDTANVWSSNGSLVFGFGSGAAYGINALGQVVGISYLFSSYPYAALFGSANNTQNLGTLGGTSSLAYAINSSNYVVGEADSSGSCVSHFAVWHNNSVFDYGCGDALDAISSDNWTVGYRWRGVGSASDCHPWANTNDGCDAILVVDPACPGHYYLNSLLDSSGANWKLKHANGINDSHNIVGYGVAPDGALHAFMLVSNGYPPLC